MKRSEYYSICFFLSGIWCSVAQSQTAKDILGILAVFYLIDMIVSAWKGE